MKATALIGAALLVAACATQRNKATAPLPKGAELRFSVRKVAQVGSTNKVVVSFETPGVGSWSCQASGEVGFASFTVIGASFETNVVHVVVPVVCSEPQCFFRVEWRGGQSQ